MGSPLGTVDDTRTGPLTHDVVDALARGRTTCSPKPGRPGRTTLRLRGRAQAPWHSTLPIAFDEHRVVVHEKRVLDEVLAADVADR